jgi:hypothetical protein
MGTGEAMIMIATIMITTTMTTDRFCTRARRTALDNLLCIIGFGLIARRSYRRFGAVTDSPA